MEQSFAIKPYEAYQTAFAPVLRAQQEGLKAFGQLARFQCTIAGDLLEHNLAGVQAMVNAATPAEYFATQGQLNVHFVGKVAAHTREFLKEAADRNVPEMSASTNMALREEEIEEPEKEDTVAAQLSEDGEGDEYQPAVESIEAQPDESPRQNATKARRSKKRSDKSRRGQAHH